MILFIGEWLQRGLVTLFGSRNTRLLEEMLPIVERVNALEPELSKLSDRGLRERTVELKKRLEEAREKGGYSKLIDEMKRLKLETKREEAAEVRKRAAQVEQAALDSVLVEAFALVREASKRTLGQRHYDVQLMGGVALHQGKIAEMVTGEGKTLVATLPMYLNALAGHGVHVVTVNDYLARRDRDWNAPVMELLGLTVGVIQQPMDSYERQREYACDITYGTNNEFGFDYLRDNMKVARERQCQGPLNYAIIDEVDSILIDEARTPLIISGAAEEATSKYYVADKVARQLKKSSPRKTSDEEQDAHFEVKEKEHLVILSDAGQEEAQRLVGQALGQADFDFYSGSNMDWPHHIDQALRAHHLYEKDVEYVVKEDEIVIVDEFTGRLMPGRTWSDGLHQAIEAKEGVRIKQETQTLATITFQNFFRLYNKISGMTGTAQTEADELASTYKLDVVTIPTNRPLIREAWPDVVYRTEREKFKAIVDEIERVHQTGRPLLVGTIAIEKSEKLSDMLNRRGIKHEVLNAKQHEREALIVAKAGQLRNVTVATNMAGRGTDILLGQPPAPAGDLTPVLEWVQEVFWAPGMPRLKFDALRDAPLDEVRSAIGERVVEATIARLEEWGKKIGGVKVERAELDKKTDQERRKVLDAKLRAFSKSGGEPAKRYKDEVERFRAAEPLVTLFEAADNVERLFDHGVAGMGGLHVLGTERHEARRIDNQLRGRCGRQGDPGSSQFFLSLEDDLMRIFAPERVSRILESLGMTEGQEISHSWVTNAIARAQKKVEARNFDIRKNLLDYDQVMDEQRKLIYENRQNVLDGVDSRGMIMDMVRDAIRENVETFASDEIVPSERNYEGLIDWVKSRFESDVKIELTPDLIRGKNAEQIEAVTFELAEKLHARREQEMGAENMRHLERFLLLQKIDEKWKDHLHGMDQLRSGIGLRGYAQQDPKIAYKKEGFELFQTMIGSIQDDVTNLLYKVRLVSPEEERAMLDRMWRQSQAMGPAKTAPGAPQPPMGVGVSVGGGGVSFGQEAGEASGLLPASSREALRHRADAEDEGDGRPPPGRSAPKSPAAKEGAAAAARAMQRQLEMRERAAMAASRAGGPSAPAGPAKAAKTVGRNDPCPCGSGKKYKKCCGQGQG